MVSITTMVKQVGGLMGTKDLTDWENLFVSNILEKTAQGDNTTSLTEKQIGVIERIYSKHFAS